MKKIYIPLLTLALAACQEGNITPDAVTTGEMSFKVLAPGAVTKVTGNAFDSMDKIGLYVTDYVDDTTPMPLQISGNRANNLTVTFDGSVWAPEKTIYWGAGKSDVYAYYPYFDQVQDVESQFFAVATDQRGNGYEASDLLWAKAEGVKQTDGAVNLQMNHIMSKLTVMIVAGEDYIGSLPDDASVLLHSTVTGARVDLSKGSVSKDPYSGAKSIKMKKLGIRTYEGVQAVVYEAIVVPQMLETSVPLLEINSKSVSYLLEDPFNFRPGVAYTYTATLNTSTTSIKVDIGCELEDWNSAGGESGGEGEEDGDGSGEGEEDETVYTDLSSNGTANCYIVKSPGNYKFKSVVGNTNTTAGNVKSVEVLWESFGTAEMPNEGDLIASVSYEDGYVRFSTPEEFRNGNAMIAVKNSKGVILWSWHIWFSEYGWNEVKFANTSTIWMDVDLGSVPSTSDTLVTERLLYQWGRKDPFMSTYPQVVATGVWQDSSDEPTFEDLENNPMTRYSSSNYLRYGSEVSTRWDLDKTIHDPCPAGWKVPAGDENNSLYIELEKIRDYKIACEDSQTSILLSEPICLPETRFKRSQRYWTSRLEYVYGNRSYYFYFAAGKISYYDPYDTWYFSLDYSDPVSANPIRCQKE